MRWLLGLILLALAAPVEACTIPVSRYALERWDLAGYDVIVYHRGPLDAKVQQGIDAIQRANLSNAHIQTIDLDEVVEPRYRKIWEQLPESATLPHLQVRLASSQPSEPALLSVPFTLNQLKLTLDSPARQELVKRLSRGETTVFLLMSSGDADKDDEIQKLLVEKISRMEREVRLPVQSKEGPQIKLRLPLQVKFSMLVLQRDQAGDDAFVQMLLNSEEGLEQVKGPIVFPIFGRGRLLGSLYGNNLTAELIGASAQYLCNACSCQVKELNPGIDLLISADWKGIFDTLLLKDGEAIPVPEAQGSLIAASPSPVSDPEGPQIAASPLPFWDTKGPQIADTAPNAVSNIWDSWLSIVVGVAVLLAVYVGSRSLTRPRIK